MVTPEELQEVIDNQTSQPVLITELQKEVLELRSVDASLDGKVTLRLDAHDQAMQGLRADLHSLDGKGASDLMLTNKQ